MLQSAARFAKNLATEDLGGALEGAARDFYEKGANERAGVLSTRAPPYQVPRLHGHAPRAGRA